MSGRTLDIATEGLLQTAEQQAAAQVIVQQNKVCAVTQLSDTSTTVARTDNVACTPEQINSVAEVIVNSPLVVLPADCLPPRVIDTGLPPALTGDKYYMFTQSLPSALWVIAHGLAKNPSVTVVDSSGSVVFGDVTYTINNDTLQISFAGAFSGKAYLN